MALNQPRTWCATRAGFTLGLAVFMAGAGSVGEAAGPFGWKWGREKSEEKEKEQEKPAAKPTRKKLVTSTADATTARPPKAAANRPEVKPENRKQLSADHQQAVEALLRSEATPAPARPTPTPTRTAQQPAKPTNQTVASDHRVNPPPPSRPTATAPLRKSVSSDAVVTKVSSRVASPGAPAPQVRSQKSQPVVLGRNRWSTPDTAKAVATKPTAATATTPTKDSSSEAPESVTGIEWATLSEPAQETFAERIVAQPLSDTEDMATPQPVAAAPVEQSVTRTMTKPFDGWTRVPDEVPQQASAPAATTAAEAPAALPEASITPVAFSNAAPVEAASPATEPLVALVSTSFDLPSVELSSACAPTDCEASCPVAETCGRATASVSESTAMHPRRIAGYAATGGLLLFGCGLALLRAASRRMV